MALALPSKKIQALIIIISALFIGYALYAFEVKAKILSLLTGTRQNSSLSFVDEGVRADLDTDSDNLKDWQEVLWKTDVNNPDSDGDGVFDGDEVIAERDPVIAGPEDSLMETRGVTNESSVALSESVYNKPDNLSATLSRGLFAQFMSQETSGQLTDEQSQQQLVADALANASPSSVPPEYTIADLKIVDSSSNSLRVYGNSLGSIIASYQKKIAANKDNQFAINSYQQMVGELKSLPVPGSVGLQHLRLINSFYFFYTAMVNINSYENDPLKALLAIQSLQENSNNNIAILREIANEFKNNGIIFTANEAGNIWNNY